MQVVREYERLRDESVQKLRESEVNDQQIASNFRRNMIIFVVVIIAMVLFIKYLEQIMAFFKGLLIVIFVGLALIIGSSMSGG